MNDLRAYAERVDAAAASPLEDTIFNGSAEHAQIVIAALLRNAKKTATALAGGLNNRVWGHESTIQAAREFLDRGGRLSIVIDEDLDRDGARRNLFCQALGARFELRCWDTTYSRMGFHFLQTDSNSLRLESDKEQRTAIAYFNQPHRAEMFADFFRTMPSSSALVGA